MIKTVLALQHETIPPQIHLEQPNPHVPWPRIPLKLVEEPTSWSNQQPRLAGVTALGLAGTNAHIILGDAPVHPDQNSKTPMPPRQEQLLVISARSKSALNSLAKGYCECLQNHPNLSMADVCYTASTGRRHWDHRVAFCVRSVDDAIEQLQDWLTETNPSAGRRNGQANSSEQSVPGQRTASKGDLIWQFVDQAAPMETLHSLLNSESTVAELLARFQTALNQSRSENQLPGLEFVQELQAGKLADEVIQFCLHASLANLWQHWGIECDGVMGTGVGQYAAACMAGGLAFEDALILVFEASQLRSREHTDPERKSQWDDYESRADRLNYYPPNLPLLCSKTESIVPVHRSLSSSYWRAYAEQPSESTARWKGMSQFAPGYVLQLGITDDDSTPLERDALIPCLDDSTAVTESLLNTLGKLYRLGWKPDFSRLFAEQAVSKVRLPNYPFQRKRYWITEIAQFMESSALEHSEVNSK